MHLVMLDIDGTLTETMKVDTECFVRSLAEVCDFTDVETDWSKYRHTTDSGIFHEIYLARTRRPPSVAEISCFRQHFITLLTEASSKAAFAPINGAQQLLSILSDSAEHRASLATGGWTDSARLKMASAGMCFDDHPATSADDAHDRESIMKISMQRAIERHGMSFISPPCKRCGWPAMLISATPSRICTSVSKGTVCSLNPCPSSNAKMVTLPAGIWKILRATTEPLW